MPSFRGLTVIALITVLLADVNTSANANNTPDILALDYQTSPYQTRIIVELSNKARYRYFSLTAPERLVVDIKNINDIKTRLSRTVVNSGLVNRIRSARRNRSDIRLVLDISTDEYTKEVKIEPYEQGAYRLLIDVIDKRNNNIAAAPSEAHIQTAHIAEPPTAGDAMQSPEQRLNALFEGYQTLPAEIRGVLFDKWQSPDTPLPLLMNKYSISKFTLNTFAQRNGLTGVNELDGYLLRWSVISQENIQLLLQRRPQDWTLSQAEEVLFSLLQNPSQRTRPQVELLAAIGYNTFETMGVFHLLSALEASGHPELAIEFPLHGMLIKVLPDTVYERMPFLPVTSQYAVWLMHEYSIKELINMGTPESVLQAAVKQLNVDNIQTPKQLADYYEQQKNAANRVELEPLP